MVFANRQDAAQKLIPLLRSYAEKSLVVMAVLRGGVPIGYAIAMQFHCPLEPVPVKKIGHPFNREFAIGAVSPDDELVEHRSDVRPEYVDQAVRNIRDKLNERQRRFSGSHQPVGLENKTILLVDDGIATGHTLQAAILMLRKKHPERIVVAVPVASTGAARKIRRLADDFLCLHEPPAFGGVGEFYHDFREVSEEEVMRLVSEANAAFH